MTKKRWLILGLVLLAGLGLKISLSFWLSMPEHDSGLSEKEITATEEKLHRDIEAPVQTAAKPLDLKHPVRLAIGNIGQTDDEKTAVWKI
jgi:hypothetical protein